MKKRFLTLLLAGTTAAMMFVGCGNKTEEAGITPAPTVEAEVTETPVPTEEAEVEAPSSSVAKVTLGQYKGLTLYEVDSEVIAEEMKQTMLAYAELVTVDRAAAMGDTVNINYVGKKDGVAFEGGTYEEEGGFDLELGSGSFISGFEEGLVGAVAGEVKDINLTFPEEYQSAELAGQAVVFTVTVNEVKESVVPELTDAFVAENLGYDTTAEYILALYDMKNKESYIEQVWTKLLENCTIEEYPADVLEQEKQALVTYYTSLAEYYAPWYGMDTETFLISSFGSMDLFYEMCDAYARDTVTQNLILAEIATAENLTMTEEQYQESALQYALANGYEDVATFEADYGRDEIFKVMTQAYIIEYIISEAEIIKAEGDGNIQQVQ